MSTRLDRRNALTLGAASVGGLLLSPSKAFAGPGVQSCSDAVSVVMLGIEPTTLPTAVKSALFTSTNVLDDLPNESSYVSTTSFESDGSLSYLVDNIAAKGQRIEVRYDYAKFTPYTDSGGNVYRVGIGIRITAKVNVRHDGVNTGNLFGLGVSASKDDVSGTIEAIILGISGPAMTNALPGATQITADSLQSAISMIANVKSHIYDGYSIGAGQNAGTVTSTVRLTPQYIARQVAGQMVNNKFIITAATVSLPTSRAYSIPPPPTAPPDVPSISAVIPAPTAHAPL